MLFTSLVFLVFAVAFFTLWPLVRGRDEPRWVFLVTASFIFYGWWDWRFLSLILASGVLDFVVGLGMVRFPRRRSQLLLLSIIGNLGVLGTFKYLGFFTRNLNTLLGVFGTDVAIPSWDVVLPIGISFYTFQSMSYTIDVYRGKLAPTTNPFHFFAYLSLFPQLVAGPIIRASDLLPQLRSGRPATDAQRWEGLVLVVHGYFKKTVLADNLATIVNIGFGAQTTVPSALHWWVIAIAFTMQIYFDFSGYTDIARGLAKWMGYEFALNFDHPYASTSMREFWGRWHISLSTWFRDYVYIPLGGSRGTPLAAQRNMWITMLLSGLWHGAAWPFVAWGALHAGYLSIERMSRWPTRLAAFRGGPAVAWLVTFVEVTVAFVFFRAATLDRGLQITAAMFDLSRLGASAILQIRPEGLAFLALGIVWEAVSILSREQTGLVPERSRYLAEPVVLAAMIAACIFLRGPGNEFIYFQF